MSTWKKSLSVLLAVMLVCALALAPANAFADDWSYTPINGTSTTLNKYLVMDKDANVPNATFTFSIDAGAAVAATGTTLEVFAGPVVKTGSTVTAPTITGTAAGEAAFGPTFSTTDGTPTDSTDTTKKYAQQTLTVDFSGVTFPEPGVYRYVITEAGDNQGVTNDSKTTRVLDVYVTDNNGTLTIPNGGYVLHETTAAPAVGASNGTAGGQLEDKSTGFTNEYASQNLTFSKTVAGNQASRDKYFKFTVTISGAVAGTKYTVDLSNGVATSGSNSATKAENRGKTNVTELTVGSDGTVTQDFYLQNGQSITIKGLATGTAYAVTEDAEDYKSALTTGKDPASGTIASADVDTGYTNTRDGAVPTGVMLSVIPGVVIVLAAAAALILLSRRKKSET